MYLTTPDIVCYLRRTAETGRVEVVGDYFLWWDGSGFVLSAKDPAMSHEKYDGVVWEAGLVVGVDAASDSTWLCLASEILMVMRG